MKTDENPITTNHSALSDETKGGQAVHSPLSAINRRRFLAFTSGCFLGAAPVLAGGSRPIDIGPLKDFARDGISEKFIQHNFFVIRNRGRLYATIATCPHKGNYLLVDPKNATRIICSGHDSVFNAEGMTTGGKAKRNLARFAIALNAQGRVLVNTDKDFQQTQWNDKASYVAVR